MIEQGNKKNSFQFGSVLIAYPNADGIGGGIGFKVKREKGDQRTIGIDTEERIIL